MIYIHNDETIDLSLPEAKKYLYIFEILLANKPYREVVIPRDTIK